VKVGVIVIEEDPELVGEMVSVGEEVMVSVTDEVMVCEMVWDRDWVVVAVKVMVVEAVKVMVVVAVLEDVLVRVMLEEVERVVEGAAERDPVTELRPDWEADIVMVPVGSIEVDAPTVAGAEALEKGTIVVVTPDEIAAV